MGMVVVKEKKHPNPVTLKADEKSGKDPLLQAIGLVDAEPSDITRDHNRILYGNLRKGTIKRIHAARKRMKKSYVSHEEVMREFLR